MSQHKEQQGYVTFAHNTPEVNYLELAYLQCLNIKCTQQINSYAVIVDQKTLESVEQRHRDVFDYIIPVDHDYNRPEDNYYFGNEHQVFKLTPFKETVKLESDLLFTRSIDHWWTAFRLKNVCLSTGARTFLGINFTIRKYRELFDANELPDVYNGLMYFRYSQEAAVFFDTARYILFNWQYVRTGLKNCLEEYPSTDVLYGLTALMVGKEMCTMPSLDFLNFVHMKSAGNGWSDNRNWLETVMHEQDGDIVRINNINQYHPVHYHDKQFATRELIEYYERRRTEFLAGS